MKKLLLSLMFLALAAAPALAYVQNGHVSSNTGSRSDAPGVSSTQNADEPTAPTAYLPDARRRPRPPGGDGDDKPTAPVPEPGTMALTSMGLLALGAAARKRRGN